MHDGNPKSKTFKPTRLACQNKLRCALYSLYSVYSSYDRAPVFLFVSTCGIPRRFFLNLGLTCTKLLRQKERVGNALATRIMKIIIGECVRQGFNFLLIKERNQSQLSVNSLAIWLRVFRAKNQSGKAMNYYAASIRSGFPQEDVLSNLADCYYGLFNCY